MASGSRVEIVLPAKADNVPLIRHALSGVAEALEMEPSAIADLKTVVTEACMNVVLHAYDDDHAGPLSVSVWSEADQLVVRVSDRGKGIRPLADVEQRSLRLGLPLIAALTQSFEIRGGPEGGTAVTMRVALAGVPEEPVAGQASSEPAPEETSITLPADELLAPVLSRVVSMFAARADFSVDELSDAVLLSDALSARAPDKFPDGLAKIAVSEHDDAFSLRLGPLDEGGAQRLLDGLRIPMLDASLEGLAEEVTVERGDGGERLMVRISRSAS